jgi:hypothetical protein
MTERMRQMPSKQSAPGAEVRKVVLASIDVEGGRFDGQSDVAEPIAARRFPANAGRSRLEPASCPTRLGRRCACSPR